MVGRKKGSGYPTLVGIALEGNRIEVVRLRRVGTRFRVQNAFQAPVSSDQLQKDPDRVGREIRQHLADAGIREKRCVVLAPLSWAFTRQVDVPKIPDNDVKSYLDIQAERAFAFDRQDLSMSVSHVQMASGSRKAALVAIPVSRLSLLQKALKIARLQPISVSLGVASLAENGTDRTEGSLILSLDESTIDLAVSVGGGIASLRTLHDCYTDHENNGQFDIGAIIRHIRITLGQLPEEQRAIVKTVRIFGPEDRAALLTRGLETELKALGMNGREETTPLREQITNPEAVKGISPSLLTVTVRYLIGKPATLEFLIRPQRRLPQVIGRISSRRFLCLAGTAACLLLFIGGALVYQHLRLSDLEKRWSVIEPKVTELETLQGKVKKFRSWFDDSPESLRITAAVTEAFPEEGVVWAKTLEIKDLSQVYCSGFARTNQDWLNMLDRIRELRDVKSLQVEQVRGDKPLEFSFSFRWSGGIPDES